MKSRIVFIDKKEIIFIVCVWTTWFLVGASADCVRIL